MRFTHVRIVTRDVPRLVSFYHDITEITPAIGGDDYVELRTSAGTLAICSQRSVELYGARAAVAESNRTAIIEFQVEDVDRERSRLDSFVKDFELDQRPNPGAIDRCCFEIPTVT